MALVTLYDDVVDGFDGRFGHDVAGIGALVLFAKALDQQRKIALQNEARIEQIGVFAHQFPVLAPREVVHDLCRG